MPPAASTTSFIPKSSFEKSGYKSFYKDAGLGFVFKITAFLLLFSLVAFGGVFLYKKNLTTQIEELQGPLDRAKAAFDVEVIGEMEKLMRGLGMAEKLVNQHRFPSHIFKLLEELTYEEVRFTGFGYSYKPPKATGSIVVTRGDADIEPVLGLEILLGGEAKNFTAMAKQAEIFKRSELVEDAVFSTFALTKNGDVSFSLKLTLNPKIISYD